MFQDSIFILSRFHSYRKPEPRRTSGLGLIQNFQAEKNRTRVRLRSIGVLRDEYAGYEKIYHYLLVVLVVCFYTLISLEQLKRLKQLEFTIQDIDSFF
jgi:hypothetical protein